MVSVLVTILLVVRKLRKLEYDRLLIPKQIEAGNPAAHSHPRSIFQRFGICPGPPSTGSPFQERLSSCCWSLFLGLKALDPGSANHPPNQPRPMIKQTKQGIKRCPAL